jgi:hypothetical protein
MAAPAGGSTAAWRAAGRRIFVRVFVPVLRERRRDDGAQDADDGVRGDVVPVARRWGLKSWCSSSVTPSAVASSGTSEIELRRIDDRPKVTEGRATGLEGRLSLSHM